MPKKLADYHGTWGGYTNHNCRCALCTRAHATSTTAHFRAKRVAGICRQCILPAGPRSKTFCEFHREKHNEEARRHNAKSRVILVPGDAANGLFS